jgi:glycosyltransferase involved in cell wall biosynthesis
MPINHPLITIGCLSYNTGGYVVEAIKSILNSSYKHLQIIVVDDCSKDNSVEILEKFLVNYPNIEFVKNEVNLGIPSNFNLVLKKAKGKYLSFVCDDLVTKTRFEDDVEVFEQLDLDYILVHSISQSINSFGEVLNETSPNLSNYILYKDFVTINEIIKNPFINAVTTMFRVDLVKTLGGWDESLLFEDNPFWFKICEEGKKIKFIPKINTYYRKHANNTSNDFRYGFWIYQFELYGRYSYYREAQIKLKQLLSLSCGAIDFDRCLELYLCSANFSYTSYFKWFILNKLGYHYFRRFFIHKILRKVKRILNFIYSNVR